jgi:hypothetical protein
MIVTNTIYVSTIQSQLRCNVIRNGDITITTYNCNKIIYFFIQKDNEKTYILKSPFNYNKIAIDNIHENNYFVKVMKMIKNCRNKNIEFEFYIADNNNLVSINQPNNFIKMFFDTCMNGDKINYINTYKLFSN